MTRFYDVWLQEQAKQDQRGRRYARLSWVDGVIRQRGWNPIDQTVTLMLRILGAARPVCRHEGCDQYREDIRTFAGHQLRLPQMREILRASGFSRPQIEHWFAIAEEEEEATETADGFFALKDDCEFCDHRGVYVHEEDTFEVRVSGHSSETWSQTAVDDDAFYCDISNRWYSGSNFIQSETNDGQAICDEIATAYDYRWSEDREYYVHVDDWEEDDIPGYHDGERNWDYLVADRSTRGFYGIELEVDFPRGDRRVFLVEHLDGTDGFCGEQDSSLDETGMEIVMRPFSLQELQSAQSPVRALFGEFASYGVQRGHGEYGCHVTANWGRLSPFHKARFEDFIYANEAMTVFISERRTTYASFEHRGAHHSAVHRRHGGAVEVRTFRSTIDYSRLLSYVEYVDAVTEWTRNPENLIRGPLAASLFRQWVRTHPTYPHLAARFPLLAPVKETVACA